MYPLLSEGCISGKAIYRNTASITIKADATKYIILHDENSATRPESVLASKIPTKRPLITMPTIFPRDASGAILAA
jgi:hypothetical protein